MGNSISKDTVVDGFDTQKYLGKWYEVARYPFFFEKDCSNVTAEYQLMDDDMIKVINKCHDKDYVAVGRATQPEEGIGRLKVSFFPGIWGDYNILRLLEGPDKYEISVVADKMSGGDYEHLWILSRTPPSQLDRNQKMFLNKAIGDLNINLDKLIIH